MTLPEDYPSLEQDILDSFIAEKAKGNERYCQSLYAALCNNEFVRGDMLEILKGEYWGCSWRYAGGLADSLYSGTRDGDYLHFYCTGMIGKEESRGYTLESVITDEIRQDFAQINWFPVTNSYDNDEI